MRNKNKTTKNNVLNNNTDQKMFLENWYSSPITKNRLAKTAALNQDSNFNTYGFETKTLIGFPEYVGYNNDASSLLSNAKYRVATANKLSNNPDGWDPEAYGGYSSEKNAYHVNRESDKTGGTVDIHELSHASDLDYINDRVWKDINKGPNGEIYPRINEIRYFSKFKPGQIINMNDVSKFKESSGYQDLKRINYSDEEILDLLNNMALNTDNNINSVQARNGGQLNMKKKNTKQYFDGGSILSLLGGATNLIPKDNVAGGAASGAINGASSLAATGNPYLIGAGALIGGVAGGIQGNKQNMQNQINPYTDGISDRNNFLNIMADGGLIEYNTGGTHEQNPLGGIPQGIAPGGQTNTVEEGETRLKDFIFSDRLKINKSVAKKFNLPDKFIGKSFADVSKTYNKELEERPNDPYTKKTVGLNMNNLMLANQEVANKKMTNMLADGGYLSPSQYSQQMQSRDFNPAIPIMEPIVDQLPQQKLDLNTQLAGMPTTFLGTARKYWPIQDQNLLNTPNMPDRTKGINPQMVSEGQQARGYNQNVENYLRDVGRIVNQSQINGDTRSQDEITRDIVGDYDKQPLTTMPFPRTFGKGGQIQHKTNPWLNLAKPQLSQMQQIQGFDPFNPDPGVDYSMVPPMYPTESTDNPTKYLNVQDLLAGAKTIGERNQLIAQLTQDPNTFAKLGKQGYSLGENSVPWQHNQGRYAGGVTENELWAANPQLMYKTFPNKKYGEPLTDNEIDQLQSAILADPGLANQVALKPNTQMGIDWWTAMGKLNKQGGDNTIPPTEVIPPPPTITTEKGRITIPPATQTTKTPGTSIKVPNLWPEAGLLSAAPYMGLKPELANPTLMSAGYLKPQLTDEMTMRSGIDSANRANIGALTGATGGNAAALRAGLLGAGNNYMNATSNAFMQGNQVNNQARMEADQFNIQNQTGVAGNNMGVLNQFELENKQLINNINAKKADEFANTMSDYVGNASIRRAVRELTDARANDIFNATGYMPTEAGTFMQVTPDRTTTNKTPGYSTSLPSAKLNFNPQAALHPSSFVPQQNPYDVAGANMLNEALEGSSLNGVNGFQQGFPGNFDPFEIQKTLNNKKISAPKFANGGCIKVRRRSLK